MHAALLLLTLALPARAVVSVAAEAGADAAAPRISLRTSLTPMSGPSLGGTMAPGIGGATLLAAPAAPTARALPASAIAAVVGGGVATTPQTAAPAALHGERQSLSAPSTPDAPKTGPVNAAEHAGKGSLSGANLFDGTQGRPETELPVFSVQGGKSAAEPAGFASRLKKGLKRLSFAAAPPLLRPLYDERSRAHYYHGLSLGTLEEAIDGGGSLKAKVTYVSDEVGYPYGYARTSARRTGTAGVVLQFEASLLTPLIVPGHYNPRAPERGEKWEDVPHWFMAEQDLPLTAQTELSKKTVLDWLAEQRDAHPEDASWSAKISKFEAAFEAKAPAPKPRAAPTAAPPLDVRAEAAASPWRRFRERLARFTSGLGASNK